METEKNIATKKSGGVITFFLGFLSIVILFGTLGGVAYYYFIIKNDKNLFSLEEVKRSPLPIVENKGIDKLVKQIKSQSNQIQALQEENALLKAQSQESITERLSYMIKPKSEFVAECYSANLGEWRIPATCVRELKANLSKLLQGDKRILVLEVIGIVDEKQYSGRSPELKQEGLASFRAKTVMMQLQQDFPNVLTFKGLSAQEKMKRGFSVRAYYAQ